MHIYRFFLFLSFVGAGYFHNSCAMELLKVTEKEDGSVIRMSHYWPQEYSNTINTIKDVDLKSIRAVLKNDNYLSPHSNTLDHLLYLSTIRRGDEVKTPFTEKQQKRFDTTFYTRRSVPRWFKINGAVILATALFSLTNLAGLAQCSQANQTACLSQTSVVMIPTASAIAGGLFVGFMSLYATGISPDQSAKKANKLQDEIGDLSRKYSTVAKYLIDMHFTCPDKAQYIADKFDIEEFKMRIALKTHNAKSKKSLMYPLEEAWHFVKYNTVLITFTEIENYIYNKIYSRQIEVFGKRIEFLEQKLREQEEKTEKMETKKSI